MERERRLLHIPIIHTEADMGGLKEELRKAALKKLGLRSWRRKQELTNRMWDMIEIVVCAVDPARETVRLYQDGLPECGREAEIVRELAGAGSRNHRLLLQLMEKGAILMGTESPLLLVQEYQLITQTKAVVDARVRAKTGEHPETMSRRILMDRDRHIANRINTTLGDGETGILLLGMLHSLDGLIDQDILVEYPLLNPAGHGG
jgi:hypothetical protein